MPQFVRQAMLYVGVFAASTVAAVLFRFTRGALRPALARMADAAARPRYLDATAPTTASRQHADGLANPDQRIAEDVRAFTTTTLSFVLMLLNGTLTVLAFSGVLWSISPLLFAVGRRLRRGRLALHGPARPPARLAQLRSVRPRGQLPRRR